MERRTDPDFSCILYFPREGPLRIWHLARRSSIRNSPEWFPQPEASTRGFTPGKHSFHSPSGHLRGYFSYLKSPMASFTPQPLYRSRFSEILEQLDLPTVGPYTKESLGEMWLKVSEHMQTNVTGGRYTGGLDFPRLHDLEHQLEVLMKEAPADLKAPVCGPLGDFRLRIDDNNRVFIPAGVQFRHLNQGNTVRKRGGWIAIHDIYFGFVDLYGRRNPSQFPARDPEITWAGAGGFWCYLSIAEYLRVLPNP